jgi:hypothetical protein
VLHHANKLLHHPLYEFNQLLSLERLLNGLELLDHEIKNISRECGLVDDFLLFTTFGHKLLNLVRFLGLSLFQDSAKPLKDLRLCMVHESRVKLLQSDLKVHEEVILELQLSY